MIISNGHHFVGLPQLSSVTPDSCDPRPPQYRTFVLTHVYIHPYSKCCVQATSSALPVQHLTLSAALSVCRNVVGISAFFFSIASLTFLPCTSSARRLFRVGNSVLVRRDIRRCAGELSKPSVGVLLSVGHFRPVWLSSATILLFSRRPLLCRCFARNAGLMSHVQNPHSRANFANSCDANCDPLSLIIVTGIPYRAKCGRSALTTACVVVFFSSLISKKLL